jgi:hypothetical protein
MNLKNYRSELRRTPSSGNQSEDIDELEDNPIEI